MVARRRRSPSGGSLTQRGIDDANVGNRARRRRGRRTRGRPGVRGSEPAGAAVPATRRLDHGPGHQRHRLAQGSPPADLLPARHPRRPVQDPVPVLPLLGGRLAGARDPEHADLHGLPPGVAGSDSSSRTEIQKLRQAWTEKKPVEWVRVHFLPRHAHFPHQRHIKALGPTACATCHGDVSRMPQVFKVNQVDNMGFCITCHVSAGCRGTARYATTDVR